MKKYNKLGILPSLMAVCMLCVLFSSCGKGSGDSPVENPNITPAVDQNVTVDDPQGTISLSMRNTDNGSTYLDNIYINKENFRGGNFASVGSVKGLGNVVSIPTTGWAEQMSVKEGNGYVAYSNNQFYRIYVISDIVNTVGGIIGSDIKYQKPFYGVDEAISLDENTLTFSASGGLQSLVFNNSSIIVFSLTSNQSWCQVQKSSTYDKYFLYNAITINVDKKTTPNSDNAIVTLTTAFNKKFQIKITRLGPEPILQLSENEKNISGEEQTINIGFTTNFAINDIQLDNSNDWLNASIKNGTNYMQRKAANIRFIGEKEQTEARANANSGDARSYYISLTAKTNYDSNPRIGKITISDKEKKVSQTLTIKQEGATIAFQSSEANFNKSASYSDYAFTSSISSADLVVKSSEEWCNPTLSRNTKSVRIAVDNNVTGVEKTAIVTLFSEKSPVSATIKVTQTSGGVKFAGDEIKVPAASSTESVSITSDFSKEEMTISSNASWCAPTITNSQSVSLKCEENNTSVERTAKITISDLSGHNTDVLLVKQDAGFLNLEVDARIISGTGITNTGIVTLSTNIANTNLVTSSKDTWCSASVSNGQLSISAPANPTEEDRTTTVTIKSKVGTLSNTLKVTQKANQIIYNRDHGDKYFDRNAGNITLTTYNTLPNIEPESSDPSWCTVTYSSKTPSSGELIIRVSNASANRSAIINFKNYKEAITVYQAKYAIKDEYNENGVSGYVNSIDKDEMKIMMSTKTYAVWSTEKVATGANSTTDGLENMKKIERIPNWETLYPAFAKCKEHSDATGVNWYIPAIKEYNADLYGKMGGEFWTSTEYSLSESYYSYYDYRSYKKSKESYSYVVLMHKIKLSYK